MSGIHGAVEWAGKHPVPTAIGVFAVGAVILLLMRGSGGAAPDNGMSSFYAAQAASAASGNQLAAVQAQGVAATAIAKIGADRDTHLGDTAAATNIAINTVQSQTDLGLAGINAGVMNNAELTRQQAQKQQFFLSVGQQQIEGQLAPWILNNPQLASILGIFAQSGTQYSPAH